MPCQSTIASVLLGRSGGHRARPAASSNPDSTSGRRGATNGRATATAGARLAVALRVALLDLALELLHHVRVAQRGHVAELAALGDVAQQPAHDLARARLGQVVGPDDALGPRELADPA